MHIQQFTSFFIAIGNLFNSNFVTNSSGGIALFPKPTEESSRILLAFLDQNKNTKSKEYS